MTDSPVKYSFFKVPSDLTGTVRHIWSFESIANDGDHFIFRTYASIYPSLFFTYRGTLTPTDYELSSGTLLSGQSKTWKRYKTSADFGVFGVTFYPFVLESLFNIPAHELTDQVFDLEKMIQNGNAPAFNKVIKCSDNGSRLEAVIELFGKQILKTDLVTNLLTQFPLKPDSGREFNVDWLLSKVPMSKRNFERKFKQHSGYTPKSFINVLRFQEAFITSAFEKPTLVDTTHALAYYDHAHFANSFKAHSGFKPRQLSKPAFHNHKVWDNFVAFFQFISMCPPVLCHSKDLKTAK